MAANRPTSTSAHNEFRLRLMGPCWPITRSHGPREPVR
jgi:hypothetical protein